VQKLRVALVDAVEPDDVRAVIQRMLILALEGDVAAARLLLDRLLGPPVPLDLLEEVEALRAELEQLSQAVTRQQRR
jgi:predicted ATP-grasp superfamily ATP-dependent carboligase